MVHIAYIAIGGALGTLLRYGVSVSVARFAGSTYPWGTLTVNLIGALFIGFLSASNVPKILFLNTFPMTSHVQVRIFDDRLLKKNILVRTGRGRSIGYKVHD
jgi:fluoride ion exporter CrcB/FEX